MSILVVADHDNDSIKASTLVSISAAAAIGGEIEVLVAGENCVGAGEAAAKIAGVSKVLVADNAVYAHALAENLSALVVDLGAKY
jgi:electron transfer flavoprotein alpha subunit